MRVSEQALLCGKRASMRKMHEMRVSSMRADAYMMPAARAQQQYHVRSDIKRGAPTALYTARKERRRAREMPWLRAMLLSTRMRGKMRMPPRYCAHPRQETLPRAV